MPAHDFDRIINRRGTDSVKWNSRPEDVLPMWVADSDFAAPQALIDALRERVEHGVFGYLGDETDIREAAAHWMRSRFSWPARPEWVEFSPGVVTSIALAVTAFSDPGDKVLFLTPSYPPFFRIGPGLGRENTTSSLIREKEGYTIDFDDLEKKAADKKCRLFILCNPHNPTGRAFSREELLRIGEVCLKHDLLIISDEIHCDYVFPGRRHLPFPGLDEELARRSLVTVNPSKTFNIAGLRCSAVLCADAGLLARFKKTARAYGMENSVLGAAALKTAYVRCAAYADRVAAYVKDNLDHAAAFITEHVPGIQASAPEATYLLWLDCREKRLEQNDLENFFLNRAKLALNSGTEFGPEGKGFMRMNLACPKTTVSEALARLEKAASGG